MRRSLVRVKNKARNTALFFVIFLFTPLFSNAQIEITEIMYNLEGADSGREWIEICNSGSEAVDLSGWKFFENGSNHGLTLVSGSLSLVSGGAAVIVSDDVKFMVDWPSFNGNLFDSAFSLSNTGELLEIRNSELIAQDDVTYSSDWGADGDGKTLNGVSGVFTPDDASPGVVSCVASSPSESNTSGDSGVWIKSDESISVDAGEDVVTVVGAEVEFESYAEGFVGELLVAERYLWNFGDGRTKEGARVVHAYAHPGKYVAVVDVSSGRHVVSDRLDVIVVPAQIFVSAYVKGDDGYVEITNSTEYELDVSGWYMSGGEVEFAFPKNSLITNVSPTRFSNNVTGLGDVSVEGVRLLFPNGTEVVMENKNDEMGDVVGSGVSNDDTSSLGTQDTINDLVEPNATELHLVNTAQEGGEDEVGNVHSLNEAVIDSDMGKGPLQEHGAAVGSLDIGEGSGAEGGIGRWLLALVFLIVVSSVGVIFVRREDDEPLEDSENAKIKKLAKSIEIIED